MATVRVFNHHVHTSFYWLALIDAALFVLALYAGTYIYCFIALDIASFQSFVPDLSGRALLYALITVVCLFTMGLYEPRMREGRSGVLVRTLGGFVAASLVTTGVFMLLPDTHQWRGVMLYTVLLSFSANLISRLAFINVTDLEQFKSRVLVYGSGSAAATITAQCAAKPIGRAFPVWDLCGWMVKSPG